MSGTVLDQYVARLQNLRPFNIYMVNEDGSVAPWYEVGPDVVAQLVIYDYDLETQVQVIAAQIQFWGRLESQAKRVWQIEERLYREWRDQKILALAMPPEDETEAKSWKKPTEKQIEALYRSDPDYPVFWTKIERAEEAFNCCHALVEAFRAKKDLLRDHVIKRHEDGAARLSV